ncbi:uncharacterized protein PGTG_21646 [Puccinia graminis f. sp. tritici CRL 75-36-700-3]|uniref:Uncharacterized protein n=1 Tax=Puccinia graminis f. sp. tritici (strain CRL 75-36-700-3 / race SCCL) TaxID=418459 RepID=H6QS76_PUCGT|nr:uncharacterized protein PGTG_21646 [Puccinia graminis f. sp. tritici CRL 75-36-700-3]EHS63540.1 hypothetical protein PGTG_21646 [Puccinia graminis f. sp. tritici CRL 75-36-700-3]
MYCEELGRWVPPEFTPEERDILVRNIVDFSAARREGFVAAYWEVFGICDKKIVLGKLQGCHEHYRAQVTRVKKNRHIVMADEENTFQTMCLALIKEPVDGDPSHEDQMDQLRRLFPKARKWFDWWTMADVEAMLFPTRRARAEDAPEGKRAPTLTTNAQESLHRLYYMFSEGKMCLQLGLVRLFSFVKVLEEDYDAVMRGVSIEYGASRKEQIDIAQSLGWDKKRKRATNPAAPANKKIRHQADNDGRPPDTTDALLPELKGKKKLGRPRGALNVDRAAFSTYPSYRASSKPHLANRCWMAAALETLFSLYSPLWLRGSSGHGTSLFTSLVKHFTARTTYQLSQEGSVRGMLSKAQARLFQHAHNLYPQSFVAGDFASADFFIEILLDPKANPNRSRQGLFDVEERRILNCSTHPSARKTEVRSRYIINIRKAMFEANGLASSDVVNLLLRWTSSGLVGTSGLICKHCRVPKAIDPVHSKQITPDISIATACEPATTEPYLEEVSTLHFPQDRAPLHLYFLLEVTSILDKAKQASFMSSIDWPFGIKIHGEAYTLFARGFWNGYHYWSKVLMNVSGVVGIWYHNDRENDGLARMVSSDLSTIGGAQPHTSWVMYSRSWTTTEREFVGEKMKQVKKDFPNARPNQIPFGNLSELLEEGTKFLAPDYVTEKSEIATPLALASNEPTLVASNKPLVASNEPTLGEMNLQTDCGKLTECPTEPNSGTEKPKPKIQRLKITVRPKLPASGLVSEELLDVSSVPAPPPIRGPGRRSQRVVRAGKGQA